MIVQYCTWGQEGSVTKLPKKGRLTEKLGRAARKKVTTDHAEECPRLGAIRGITSLDGESGSGAGG